MKKILVIVVMLAMLGTILPVISFPIVNAEFGTNMLTATQIQSTFEDPAVPAGWSAPYGGTLTTSTTVAHSGSYSLKLAGRTQTWYTPSYNIYNSLKIGGAGTYTISLWLYVDALSASPKNGSLMIRGAGASDANSFIQNVGGQYYGYIASNISTAVSTWTLYSATLNVLDTDLTRASGTFNLCIDSLEAVANQNIYIDDVIVTKTADNLLAATKSTFEDASVPTGWSSFQAGTVSTSTTVAHSGAMSLKITGRANQWDSAQYNIYSIIKAGGAGTYQISYWVYVDALTTSPGSGLVTIRGTSNNQYSFFSSGCSYGYLSAAISTPVSTWTQYIGTLNVTTADLANSTGDFNLMLDQLAVAANQNVYFDDVQVRKSVDNLVTSTQGTFEAASVPSGWSAPFGGTLSTSTTVKHSGSYSLKLAGRTQTWYAPAYNIYSILKSGGAGTYYISFWVYVDALTTSPSNGCMMVRGADSTDANSFIINNAGQYFGYLGAATSTAVNTWTKYSATLTVLASDLTRASGTFNLMLDTLGATSTQNLYMDDVQISKPSTTVQRWNMNEMSFTSSYANVPYISGIASTFEDAAVPTGWTAPYGGTLSASSTVTHTGTYSLQLAGRAQAWYSPVYNIYNNIKNGGAGTYNISLWAYVDAQTTSPSNGRLLLRATSVGQYSFLDSGQTVGTLNGSVSTATGTWTQYTGKLTVTAADISGATGDFNLCIDSLPGLANQNMYFDDVQIAKVYADPFNDITLDVTFTGPNNTTIVMPAFWDGGYTWKVRFAPTLTGLWSYSTSCSNTADTGLHGLVGNISCVAYTGNLAIYQHGFVGVSSGNRYFTYADGTPFFYIGDTHWSMPTEPMDTMFKPLVDDRVAKGFTVYQSEPIGATYNLGDGLTQTDIAGFQDMDARFKYIADAGLLHTNAELFFSSELQYNGASYSTAYLQKLTRYWVARYAAYPVMWTTAQEVDDDLYGAFNAATNPWKTVFNALHTYDPYVHPQTAHQENVSNILASTSSFKSLTGYNWFAAQWPPTKDGLPGFAVAKDYWNNSGSKPVVNYEGHYENLWTNDWGARMQGWTAYLNGMFGQGYGAQDIWYYNSTYDENEDTVENSLITVTMAMKADTWSTSKNYAAATALANYMKSFFNTINWWQLTPRFDDTTYFVNNSSYYSVASILNDTYVAYFYNQSTNTGTLKGMDNVAYTAKWYNPRTGAYTTIGSVTPTNGSWTIPAKPDGNDWVLLAYHT